MKPTSAQKKSGKNVQRYRKEAGLAQEKLGRLSGLDRGVRNPAIHNIEKIAKPLEVKYSKLFE